MIYLLFSTYSSGSTFLQKEISQYIDVPKISSLGINDTEFALLHQAALFVYAPHETIDHDPSRTFDPKTGNEISKWRENYKNYLALSNFPTIEDDFFKNNIAPFKKQYNLPSYSNNYSNRLDYIVDVFRAYEKSGPIFGKCPKWLNDFSGYTQTLLNHLYESGINIRGIFLHREPLDTLASTLDRKFRLHEVFDGNVDDYADYIYHSLLHSNKLGLDLTEQYDFHKISYEKMEEEYPKLMEFMDIREYKNIDYKRKYGRRFVLNPSARNYFERLKPCGATLGYKYPKKMSILLYFLELTKSIVRTAYGRNKDVNNPEHPMSILKRCFWHEVNTPQAYPIKALYKRFKRSRTGHT
jgi:hypothetical protein